MIKIKPHKPSQDTVVVTPLSGIFIHLRQNTDVVILGIEQAVELYEMLGYYIENRTLPDWLEEEDDETKIQSHKL